MPPDDFFGAILSMVRFFQRGTIAWFGLYSLFGLLITTLLLLCSNKDHDDGAMHGAIRFSWISPL